MTGVEDVKPGSLKAWMAFTRPKTWGVAVAPVIAALSLALFETGRFDALTAFFTMTIALLMQIISNMKNDLGYTEKKAETGNRRGLPRATTQGWISISAARRAILTLIVLALLNTAVLIWLGGWVFALIGISSVIAAYSYMGGPKPIAYTPFGEATVLVFFGLTAVCGSYYLQTFTVSANAVLLSISLGSIAAAVLAVNNWRDRVHDKSIGRQTLAVVLGDKTFTAVFRIMTALPLALGLVMAAAPRFWPCLLVLLCLPLCLPLWKQFGTLRARGAQRHDVRMRQVRTRLFGAFFSGRTACLPSLRRRIINKKLSPAAGGRRVFYPSGHGAYGSALFELLFDSRFLRRSLMAASLSIVKQVTTC